MATFVIVIIQEHSYRTGLALRTSGQLELTNFISMFFGKSLRLHQRRRQIQALFDHGMLAKSLAKTVSRLVRTDRKWTGCCLVAVALTT